MRVGRYRFAPPWWGVVAMLIGVAVFAVAGVWQIQRGQAKAAMLTQRAAADKSPAQPLIPALDENTGSDLAPLYGKDFVVRGRYDEDRQILLANQVFKTRAGYRVWTPLVLANGKRILIDRGWIPLGPRGRDQPPAPPAPDGVVSVTGLLTDLPKPGIRLGEPPRCDSRSWPRVLNYPTIDTIRCLYQARVIDGLLLLSEKAPGGFARDWQTDVGGMPPMRHYGYAFQWFALAVAVVAVFLVVNTKRIR